MKHASCALAGALILVSACIGDEFLTTSGTGGEGPSSSSLTGPSSSSVGGTDTSSTGSSVTTSTSDSSSSASTSVSSSSGGGDGGDATVGTGGEGGTTSANGGGGSSSESSAGGDSTASSSSSAGGEGGSGPTAPTWRVRWTLTAVDANSYMGLGGLINQPTGSDTVTGEGPFIDEISGDPCVTDDSTDLSISCNLGELEEGTRLQFQLYEYADPDGDNLAFYKCDLSQFPDGVCKGTVNLYRVVEGVPTLVSTFIDDENNATPLPAPWEYFVGPSGTPLDLVYPSLPD